MKRLSEYKPNEIVMIHRRVFAGSYGNLVLEDILDTLGVFDTDQVGQTTEQAALRAFGMWILNRCGINFPENQLEMVQALFKDVPIQTFEDKENTEDE